MPELPEVETTRRGIAPAVVQQRIVDVKVRERRLRIPLTPDTERAVLGQWIQAVERRGKYLLIALERGVVLVHLGMSGSLRLVAVDTPPRRHDHVDLVLGNGRCLRFHDPRRFGLVHWIESPAEAHPLLCHLGPEPLSEQFDGQVLYQRAAKRRCAVKTLIMDSRVVVGVGNIYANEALFLAGIDPRRAAREVSIEQYQALAERIRQVLSAAIEQGGTTLRDFVREDGNPGYFAQALRVYGRDQKPCVICGAPIVQTRIAQRATYFCTQCQH